MGILIRFAGTIMEKYRGTPLFQGQVPQPVSETPGLQGDSTKSVGKRDTPDQSLFGLIAIGPGIRNFLSETSCSQESKSTASQNEWDGVLHPDYFFPINRKIPENPQPTMTRISIINQSIWLLMIMPRIIRIDRAKSSPAIIFFIIPSLF
jgi:hypothetical protein